MGKNRKEGKGWGEYLWEGEKGMEDGWEKICVDNAGIGRIGIGDRDGKKKNGE